MRFSFVVSLIASLLSVVAGNPIATDFEKRQLIPAGAVNLNFTHITAHLTVLSLLTNSISLDFDIAPVIPILGNIIGLSIAELTFSAGVQGTEYVAFNHTFETPLAVPPSGTVNSGTINNVALTQGFLVTLLSAAPAGALDVTSAGVRVLVSLLNIQLPIPLFLPLSQLNVPTTWSPL